MIDETKLQDPDPAVVAKERREIANKIMFLLRAMPSGRVDTVASMRFRNTTHYSIREAHRFIDSAVAVLKKYPANDSQVKVEKVTDNVKAIDKLIVLRHKQIETMHELREALRYYALLEGRDPRDDIDPVDGESSGSVQQADGGIPVPAGVVRPENGTPDAEKAGG